MWVFDDSRTGLEKEPFVSGADRMIDLLVADITNADAGFRLIFSAARFPRHEIVVEWLREESGGNWYYSPRHGIEGWLCPALLKYFDNAPARIFIKAEPRH